MLQHGSAAVTPQLLCSLLQASSTVNQALRQARARCCVDSRMQHALATPAGLSRFCVWLSGHPGLLSTLKLHTGRGSSSSNDVVTLHNVLLLALRARAAAPVPGQAAALPFQLEKLTVQEYRVSPALLAALLPTQVQQLEVSMGSDFITPTLCGALGGLQSLHSLTIICSTVRRDKIAGHFRKPLAAAIGQLQALTRLSLSPTDGAGLQHLPTSLQSLDLQRCDS